MSIRRMCSRGSRRPGAAGFAVRALSVVAAVLGLGLGITGCTSARNALGTNTSPCFRALPVAEDAVHDHAHFTGVRLITAKQLAMSTHLLEVLRERAPTVNDVCAVAYRGRFRPSDVTMPIGRSPSGGFAPYAVVVVSRSTNKLLGVVLRPELPVRFHHVALREMR